MLDALPNWKDSALARYEGTARIEAPPESVQHIPVARLLLGELRNQLALAGIEYGKLERWLPDDTHITVYFDGTVNGIVIVPPPVKPRKLYKVLTAIPRFLIYEKTIEYGPLGYGYWFDEDDNQRNRTTPYLVGEPLELSPFPGVEEYRSITSIRYEQQTLKSNTILGTNPRFGNQYFCPKLPATKQVLDAIGLPDEYMDTSSVATVYSWWASPYGDMPMTAYSSLGGLIGSGQRYAPSFLASGMWYGYFTEDPDLAMPVPLDIYANGNSIVKCPGIEGLCYVAGVGLSQQNHLLIVRVSYRTVDLFYWDFESEEPVLCGTVVTGGDFSLHGWKFNEDGTKLAGVIPFDDLAVVEYNVRYDAKNRTYITTQCYRKDYPWKYIYTEEGVNTYSEGSDSWDGGFGESYDSNSQNTRVFGVKIRDRSKEWPIAVAYINGARTDYTISRIQTWTATYERVYTVSSESESHLAGHPYGYSYDTETTSTSNEYTGQMKRVVDMVQTTVKRGGANMYTIEDVSRTYLFNETNDWHYQAGSEYESFDVYYCPGLTQQQIEGTTPTGADWIATSKTTAHSNVGATDSDLTTGFDCQILHFSAEHGVMLTMEVEYEVNEAKNYSSISDLEDKSVQTMTLNNCTGAHASVQLSCARNGSLNKSDSLSDHSTARFRAHSAGQIISIQSAGVQLNADEATGPYTESISVAMGNSWNQADGGGCARNDHDNTDYLTWVTIYGATSGLAAPGWASVVGPVISPAIKNGQVSQSTSYDQHTDNTLSADLCVRYYQGTTSVRIDPTVMPNRTSRISGMAVPTIAYMAGSAGAMMDPTYSWSPRAIYNRGGELARFTSHPFGTVEYAISNPTIAPVGFTLEYTVSEHEIQE